MEKRFKISIVVLLCTLVVCVALGFNRQYGPKTSDNEAVNVASSNLVSGSIDTTELKERISNDTYLLASFIALFDAKSYCGQYADKVDKHILISFMHNLFMKDDAVREEALAKVNTLIATAKTSTLGVKD